MPSSSTATQLSPAELAYLHSSLSSDPPIRPDSRLATDFRPFSAETNVLPNTMGSAHVGFADGREAVVGIRAEVERSKHQYPSSEKPDAVGNDVNMSGTDSNISAKQGQGRSSWISLSLTLPGLRDDDQSLVFLEEMLRETLVTPTSSTTNETSTLSLQDTLTINTHWHWHLYIDVVLISPPEGSSAAAYPLPLLSMAIHLALRDTRIPRLKSEGEEDPLADDDWEASVWLYANPVKQNRLWLATGTPPVTLLVMVVGENVVFDPSGAELAVADGVFAVSVARAGQESDEVRVLAVRMLETSARDTFKGVPKAEGGNEWDVVPGVWRPKVGGVKRDVFRRIVNAVLGPVGKDVVGGLEGFVVQGG